MIINVFLLHNKQHRTLSFPESGRQANYICTVGELCIHCFCNQPTNPSRFPRPDYCSWQLIPLVHSRAGSRGEISGKSCSFFLSQDFSLNLFISEWAEEKILYFLESLLGGQPVFCFCLCRRCARCWMSCSPVLPRMSRAGKAGAGGQDLYVLPVRAHGIPA